MVTAYEAYCIENVEIPYETDNIRYYAREIGDFKRMLEGKMAKENDDIKQWYQYFLTYAEIELESANARLKEFRGKLNSFRMSQLELS